MKKLIAWCNQYGLYVITLFLLAFIPLYPKLPLINVIRSWVYIRLEDFLIALSSVFLLVTMIREKRISDHPLKIPVIMYWGIGALSLVNALLFIFPHLAGMFPHLALLHYFRRIEYMILCFIAYEAFRRKPAIMPFLFTLIGSYVLVILYGFGQKFLGFPAFLTMNEEFAKGVPLRLPPTARFPSTFGGHYDLAAYLVMVIPIMGSLIFGFKKIWQKIAFFVLAFLGLIMLLFTASRISFGVYLVVMSVMLFWQKKKIWILPMIVFSIGIMTLTSGASERFYKTFRVSDVVVDLSTGKPIGTLASLSGNQATLLQSESPDKESLPTGSEYFGLSAGKKSLDDQVKTVQLYRSKNIPGAVGEVATVSGSFLIQKALVYDISITTRFQGQWPKAIEAFKRNILLGSGYSSLSVAADGDFHRMLGETGILGAISFLGIIAVSFLLFIKRRHLLSPLEKSFVVGVYAGLVGILCNAVLIDAFEASKVAYTLWILLGISIALLVSKKQFSVKYFHFLWFLATRKISYVLYLFLGIWLVWGKALNVYFIGDDFTWLKWAAQSTFADIGGYFTNSVGFFYRPIPKLWYFSLFSVFWFKPFAYHFMSLVLVSLTALILYRIQIRIGIRRVFAWTNALLFSVLSIHHENVFWISGQSSLCAGLFLLSSVYFVLESSYRENRKWIWILLSYITLFLCMVSYDGMLTAPLVVALISFVFVSKKRFSLSYLLFIPGYWGLRTYAGALSMQGDYAYKISTVIANSMGNTIGYIASIFLGPVMIDRINTIRVSTRMYLKEMTAVGVIGGLIILRLIWAQRMKVYAMKKTLVWFVCFLLALAAYAPLGGMAERYSYIPSIFLLIGIFYAMNSLWGKIQILWKGMVVLVIASLLCVNIYDVQKLGTDWQKAGSVVEQALRVIKFEAFPPKNILNFYIVNTPIRYGRAWVFPTGMNDALWHIYRQSPYFVTEVSSIEEGYRATFANGDREVFIFEDFVLKRGVEEIEIIPDIPASQ